MYPMKKVILYCLFLAGVVLVTPVWIGAEESFSPPDLYASSAVLMDAGSGRILHEKNGSIPMANASTTKILTCILILENCDLDAVAEVTSRAAGQPKVRLGMKVGQQFHVKDMLYALMLESYNDCAVVLAEYAFGSVEAFAEKMNEKAREIGCEDTYFITPNGLDDENEEGFHHTTATDLARIMRYCLEVSLAKELFVEITGTVSYGFSDVVGNRSYHCNNHNALLGMMPGAISGKTGFTNDAGYCYVGAAEQEGKKLVISLLACGWPPSKNYKWVDSTKLLQYGFANYQKVNVAEGIPELSDIKLKGYQEEYLKLEVTGEMEVLAAPEERIIAVMPPMMMERREMAVGEWMGDISIYVEGESLGTFMAISGNECKLSGWSQYMEILTRRFLGIF